ncbi:MAG: ABC transporter permease [Desulfurococcaceae archaeon]|jgi:peptide/nickel transport system permease protein
MVGSSKIKGASKLSSALRVFKETLLYDVLTNRLFIAGFSIFMAILLFGVIGPFFAHRDVFGTVSERWLPPSPKHPLGTNHRGEDIYSWIAIGLSNSLWIASLAALIQVVIAFTIGMIAGYKGGVLDNALNTLSNAFMVIPMFILLLMLLAYVPAEARTQLLVAVLIGITGWPASARIIRSLALENRARDYVELAKLTNFSSTEIIFKEIAPNVLSFIAITYVNAFSGSIFAEVGIGALGFAPVDAITLGRAFNDMLGGSAIVLGLWWWFVPLGLIVTLIPFSTTLMTYGLQQVFNPRLKLSVYAV